MYGFSTALVSLKIGKKVARADWVNKGVFLVFIKGDALKQAVHEYYGDKNKDAYDVVDTIYMFTEKSVLTPWVATQEDLLASDWLELE